jgi:integrase/recombinase XerD
MLFPGRSGCAPVSSGAIARALRKAARRVGIDERVTPHTLRHCFASHLLEQGVDLRTLQVLLGHASIHTTMLYLHVAAARVQGIASPLDRLPDATAMVAPGE